MIVFALAPLRDTLSIGATRSVTIEMRSSQQSSQLTTAPIAPTAIAPTSVRVTKLEQVDCLEQIGGVIKSLLRPPTFCVRDARRLRKSARSRLLQASTHGSRRTRSTVRRQFSLGVSTL